MATSFGETFLSSFLNNVERGQEAYQMELRRQAQESAQRLRATRIRALQQETEFEASTQEERREGIRLGNAATRQNIEAAQADTAATLLDTKQSKELFPLRREAMQEGIESQNIEQEAARREEKGFVTVEMPDGETALVPATVANNMNWRQGLLGIRRAKLSGGQQGAAGPARLPQQGQQAFGSIARIARTPTGGPRSAAPPRRSATPDTDLPPRPGEPLDIGPPEPAVDRQTLIDNLRSDNLTAPALSTGRQPTPRPRSTGGRQRRNLVPELAELSALAGRIRQAPVPVRTAVYERLSPLLLRRAERSYQRIQESSLRPQVKERYLNAINGMVKAFNRRGLTYEEILGRRQEEQQEQE